MEESPIEEHAKELIEETIKEEKAKEKWLLWVSLATTIMAVISGLVSMQSEIYVTKTIVAKNDAVLLQNKATDLWNYYQAKDMRYHMYTIANYIKENPKFEEAITKYKKQKEDIMKKAKDLEKQVEQKTIQSEHYYEKHHMFMIAQLLLQIGIAVASVSALTRRKEFFYVSLISALIGFGLFIYNIAF
ncbi:DUF4337 domain-containing protein [Hydrogenobaculum acidophilum]